MFSGYSFNERTMLSLGIVDPDVESGNEVTLVWGEEGGGSGKTTVERHKQTKIRALVSPAPYSEVVRTDLRRGLANRSESLVEIPQEARSRFRGEAPGCVRPITSGRPAGGPKAPG